MEWVIIALVIFGVVVMLRSSQTRQMAQRRRQQVSAEELAGVKKAADEDVTQFGEELQRLDVELAGRDLDEGARSDFKRALDSYDAAKQSVDSVTKPEDIRHVTEILEDGRYAVACVQARVEDQPLPERRAPCFFNPQHGPSITDVPWTPAGGTARDVPACALDAERVRAGAEPDSRQVMVGSQRVPYWQAGSAYAPWAAGYYSSFGIMPMLFMGTMMGMAFGGFDGSYADGYADGQSDGGDSGGGDGGGDADGGADAGGDGGGFGDFGGGDFGGF